MNRMSDHFSNLSTSYNDLRTTDHEPIQFVRDKLAGNNKMLGADIGCGGGRYGLLLLQNLPGLHLICGDINDAMLEEASCYLKEHNQENFSVQRTDASDLRLPDNELDFIITLNAIHHFDPVLFLNRAEKALKKGGYLFVYTRLKKQNARNIWGRFFLDFKEKEDRLYDLSRIEEWPEQVESLSLEEIRFFRFKRAASLTYLLQQAENKHYSTFSLYTDDEFKEALDVFKQQIASHFPEVERVEWIDENIMIVFRKDS